MVDTAKKIYLPPGLDITLDSRNQREQSAKLLSSQISNDKINKKEKLTFFWTKDLPFSQHYITKFTVAGVT